jgi:hypothetical protein
MGGKTLHREHTRSPWGELSQPSSLRYMPQKTDRPGEAKSPAADTKQNPIERQKRQGLSKGAMAAERASAGIGTDDRDLDDWFRLTERS